MKFSTILEGVKDDWSFKEKARYITWNFSKHARYDQRLTYSTDPELVRKIYYRQIDVDKDEDPRGVCNSESGAVVELLGRVGVPAEVIYKPSSIKRAADVPDAALIFYDEVGKKYYVNMIGDLENCKFGTKTTYWGIDKNGFPQAQDVEKVSSEELRAIDVKVGNIKEKCGYSDVVFHYLKKELRNPGNFRKFLNSMGINTKGMDKATLFENKMMFLNRYIKFTDKTAGTFERKQFYKRLFSSTVLDKFESRHFTAYDFHREKPRGELDEYSVLELNLPTRPIYYMYDEEEMTYVQTDPEILEEKLRGAVERKNRLPSEVQKIRAARTLREKGEKIPLELS